MAKKDIIRKIKNFIKALEEEGVRIKSAYLYGSYVTGNAKPYSDFDVALVSRDFTGDPVKDVKTVFPALKRTDTQIEPVYFRPEDFRDEDPLIWEIKKKGLRIK